MDVEDLATGNAGAGHSYFNGAGGCSGCHSPKHDLRRIASRYEGLALLRRMLYPSGQPAPARPKVILWLPSGSYRVYLTDRLAGEVELPGTLERYSKRRLLVFAFQSCDQFGYL